MAGQTLSEIRALLAAAGLAPRQRYGQNFLIDLNLMRKLVAAAALRPDDVVLEVGCGTGSLTEMLLESEVRVVGVEIDHGLQAVLRERLGDHPRFTLIQGDALAGKHQINPLVLQVLAEQLGPAPGAAGASSADKTAGATTADEPSAATSGDQTLAATSARGASAGEASAATSAGGRRRLKLVSNLPYDIATPLLMELLYASPRPELLACTIQREVGQRLGAEAGSDAYGPVSVILQILAEVELLAIVPPTAFWPRPQVESVMVTIRPRPPAVTELDDVAGFVRFVRQAFQQRRKMMKKAAEGWGVANAEVVFGRARVNPNVRPEEVAPEQWRELYRSVRAESGPS